MNPITPAYSVIVATLVLLGTTLAGLPASVLAQEESSQVEEVAPENVETVEAASTTTGSDEAVEPAATLPTDSYKREGLVSDRAFSDFVVGPGRFELQLAPGQSKTVEVTVANRMGIPKIFSLTTEDMAGTTDTDEAIRLLGDEVGPYSLKDFISVPEEKFYLDHAQLAHIPVTVSIPPDAEPGGFYGALLTQIVSEDTGLDSGEISTGSKVISRIGTLFFITTPGEIAQDVSLESFSTVGNQRFFASGPIRFDIVTKNSGSVHVRPSGTLQITNTLGNEVGFVEIPPWYVLPNSIRNKEINWERELLVGRYTATLTYNRGYEGIVDTVSYTFWVIPLELAGGVFGGFFIIFVLIRFFFSRFEFKRKGT